MNPLVITCVKSLTNLVTNLGVATCVGNAVKMTTPDKVGKLAKVGILVGGFFLTSMVGEKVGIYAESQVDKVVDAVKNVKIEINKEEIENKEVVTE